MNVKKRTFNPEVQPTLPFIRTNAFDLAEFSATHSRTIEAYLQNVLMRVPKDNAKAETYRVEGDRFLDQDLYRRALEFYNKSMCYAETDSDHIALGYANRSLVYLKWGLYNACLESIRLAKEAGYPDHLIHDLNNRERQCVDEMRKELGASGSSASVETRGGHAQLSFPANPKIPALANCIEIRESRKFGRHFITTEELRVGQIIGIEEPYCLTILEDDKYRRCTNCLEENEMNLIPCLNCASAMFCSQKCYDEAHAGNHQIECQIVDYIFQFGQQALALSSTIKVILTFDGADELMAAVEQAWSDKSAARFTQAITARDHFEWNLRLATNEDKRPVMDKNYYGALALKIRAGLLGYTSLGERFVTDEQKHFLLKLCFYELQMREHNAFGIYIPEDECGSGIYTAINLFNHACAPNVLNENWNSKMVAIVLRPIMKGEQLFICYGAHHWSTPLAQRRLDNTYFLCECVACVNDYATLSELEDNPILTRMDAGIIRAKTIEEKFRRVCDALQSFDHHYPCEQIKNLQKQFVTCCTHFFRPPKPSCAHRAKDKSYHSMVKKFLNM